MDPLNMPKGSVRSILALFSVIAIIGAYITAIFVKVAFPAELLAVATFIIGYYFGVREK